MAAYGTAMDARAVADALERDLAEHGTPERAEKERRYLKSELRHLGASVPATRAAVKRLVAGLPELTHDDAVDLAVALWDAPVHERRAAAVELLDLRSDLLTAADLPVLERLLREARTWALVDGLAASVVGAVRERHPDEAEPTLRAWAGDEDFWLRRASLLAYLVALRAGAGDFDRFADKADRLLEDREWFVRKALGWVLRDTGRRRPAMVVDWLEPRVARAAPLTLREAVKHLPDDDRARLSRAADR
ncbi:DNA alkylation repair protein [Egicoccus sp. AB-alg2]|uniref:DNA alkylation repair protein n=1 Tax=Egicoccus sp. AB-alg2 TaxID=3242693 RepID=UPI00359DA289